MAFDNEARLVARVVAGDQQAFEEFISTYRRLILGVLRGSLSLSPEDADEVFQRFRIRIWENDFARLKAWRGKSSLAAYLARIARNLGHDFHREAPAEGAADLMDIPTPEEPSNADDITALEVAIAQLSTRDRELIHRRYDLGQSYREIAAALKMTMSNVGVSLMRAERRLKSLVRL
jgi:RNA polymerase sigma-70 factor (ECF subfamily)